MYRRLFSLEKGSTFISMQPQSLNISRAALVNININDYDQIPLTLTYTDTTDPMVPVPIDIRTYAFSFDLKAGNTNPVVKNYPLAPAGSSAFLSVTGADHNILDMSLMWADIKSIITFDGDYRLIQLVTDNLGNSFVHVIYTINAKRD